MPPNVIPFHTYLFKVASRCNINCRYCYVYNLADDRWSRQPPLMTAETAAHAARKICGHLLAHGKRDCAIIFHGGEPLIGGLQHIQSLVDVILCELVDQGIAVTLGMQSNGMLFEPDVGDLLRRHGMTIGVSLDGPPEVNDRQRLDHQNRPTTVRLEPRLRLLADEYSDVFSGFLTVIDPLSDPTEVLDYLSSYRPPSIDFLLPLNNHDRPPLAKINEPFAAPYGDWLVAVFDHWSALNHAPSIRIFRSIINMWLGDSTLVESLGLLPVDLVVVETNGELEAVDSLKATYQGASSLGFDVFRHEFDDVARHTAVLARQSGLDSLCDACSNCDIVQICGGGYIPHRYSSQHGFLNPSVYCADLQRLINHIGYSILRHLKCGVGREQVHA